MNQVSLKYKDSLVKSAEVPSADEWLKEASEDPTAENIGMYLTHAGIVRKTAKAKVREGAENTEPVIGMFFSYNEEEVLKAISETYGMQGVFYIRVWLNSGELKVGDTIMRVLIGGDIRPNVIDGLQYLVGRLKKDCVVEDEKY